MSPRGGGGTGSRPITGQVITRNSDGEMEDVSIETYGTTSGTAMLLAANAKTTKKVRKGEKLIIPGERPAATLTGKEPDDLTVVIGGVTIPMMSCKIIRSIDTACDGFVGRIAWTPGEKPDIDRVTRPYGYERCAAYIGNELQIAGCLYIVSPGMDHDGITKELTGFSFTADALDSSVLPPLEREGVTLKQLAGEFADMLGIGAYFQGGDWWKGKFSRVTANEGETIFQFLSRLAAQRGGLLSNTRQGDMLFLKADTRQRSIGTLTEGVAPVQAWKATYDGRKRFYAYRCITAGVKGRSKPNMLLASNAPAAPGTAAKVHAPVVIEYDHAVPRSRFQTFHADDVTPGNIANAAKYRRNKQFVDALTLPFPVSGWYGPDDKLWDVGKLVTVVSPVLSVPQGFTFLIRSVEFDLTDRGRTATLHLVPPEAYSGKEISDVWRPRRNAKGGWELT